MDWTNRLSTTAPVALLATALLGFGCTSTTPPPAIEIDPPEVWHAIPPRDVEPGPPSADWWIHFGDETLSALVEEALAANHDLRAAASRVDTALAQARIAGAARKPSLSGGLNNTRRRQNFIGFPIPGSESAVLSSTTTTYGASLNASWEIDLWGRLGATAHASAAEVEASRADYRAARLSLAGQTAKAWFALVEAAQQVELAEKILDSRSVTRERIQRRFNLGIRDALDLRLALTNEASATAELAARRRQRDAVTRQLEALLTRYPEGSLTAIDALPEAPDEIGAGVPSELLLRRPDLEAAGARLAAAGFRIDAARRALYPRLTLTGTLGRSTDELADLVDDDFSVWSLAASLLQPIFEGGRLRANVDLSEANQRAALESYRQTILGVFAEVETALASEGFLRSERQAQESAAANAIASAELAERRYDSGLSDYLAVLTAQVTSQRTQSQLLSVRRQQLDARVDLILALGGGWTESSDAGVLSAPTAEIQPTTTTSEVIR